MPFEVLKNVSGRERRGVVGLAADGGGGCEARAGRGRRRARDGAGTLRFVGIPVGFERVVFDESRDEDTIERVLEKKKTFVDLRLERVGTLPSSKSRWSGNVPVSDTCRPFDRHMTDFWKKVSKGRKKRPVSKALSSQGDLKQFSKANSQDLFGSASGGATGLDVRLSRTQRLTGIRVEQFGREAFESGSRDDGARGSLEGTYVRTYVGRYGECSGEPILYWRANTVRHVCELGLRTFEIVPFIGSLETYPVVPRVEKEVQMDTFCRSDGALVVGGGSGAAVFLATAEAAAAKTEEAHATGSVAMAFVASEQDGGVVCVSGGADGHADGVPTLVYILVCRIERRFAATRTTQCHLWETTERGVTF